MRNFSRLYCHGLVPDQQIASSGIAVEDGTIAELAVARDSAGAVQALKDHLERTAAALLAKGKPGTEM